MITRRRNIVTKERWLSQNKSCSHKKMKGKNQSMKKNRSCHRAYVGRCCRDLDLWLRHVSNIFYHKTYKNENKSCHKNGKRNYNNVLSQAEIDILSPTKILSQNKDILSPARDNNILSQFVVSDATGDAVWDGLVKHLCLKTWKYCHKTMKLYQKVVTTGHR